jgi:RNA polymerase sigma factor (sigma-70 family)
VTPDERDAVHAEVMGERRHLVSLAFRMLGTVAEAEDAVQETYLRWYRLSQGERDAIAVPRAWLTRAASRICLNVLSSARQRRERYVGPWLPEPIPAYSFPAPDISSADPLDRVTLDESVSTALLVVLEAMTPAERVAFILHDVFATPFDEIAEIVGRTPAACRQLARSARRKVQHSRSRRASRAEHDDIVRAFSAAVRTGDMAGLVAVLDPEVELRSDGGGVVAAARNPVHGSDRVARLLLGSRTKYPGSTVLEQETPDGLGFAIWDEGNLVGIATLEIKDGLVTNVRVVVNPAKLTLWT